MTSELEPFRRQEFGHSEIPIPLRALLIEVALVAYLPVSVMYLELCLSHCVFPSVYHRPSIEQKPH